MEPQYKKRSAFSGKIGFVLSAAGASVGLGNIWRFPYLAAKYGGGIFLLIYILLAFTFGYTMIVAETALGRMTKKSPVGAFAAFGKKGGLSFGGWINAIIPILIVPYYSVIGGWVIRYLAEYIAGHGKELATDGYFSSFISNGASAEICFVIFTIFTLAIIFAGVRNGVERVSKVMMPILVVLSVIIAGYSVTRPGALAGVKYFLVPNVAHFSWMTVVTAMGQMFYSLSIAMGILVTFGSYMKKDVSIEESTENVEIFDTAIAIMAGLMIIPAVFSFSGGDPDTLQAGPALMFITIPKVFESMGLGTVVGILFFTLVLFAAVTSSIALTESAVSTFEDELGWDRHQATVLIGVIMLVLGSLSALGYGPLAGVTVFGMQFLDFFDFLTNSVMMPIAAITTCLLVSRVIGVKKIEEEVTLSGKPFRRKSHLQLYDPAISAPFSRPSFWSARWQMHWAGLPCKRKYSKLQQNPGGIVRLRRGFMFRIQKMQISPCSPALPNRRSRKLPRSWWGRTCRSHLWEQQQGRPPQGSGWGPPLWLRSPLWLRPRLWLRPPLWFRPRRKPVRSWRPPRRHFRRPRGTRFPPHGAGPCR